MTTIPSSLQEHAEASSAANFRQPESEFGNAFDSITIDESSGAFTPTSLRPPPAPAGISIGNLGRKIKFLGRGFRSTGALIQALHSDTETHIMLNPQIVTEHNVAAEIFVGEQTPIKGQSVANTSVGGGNVTDNLVTTNYETQETGVSLKVTPLISSHNTVTLILEQKISATTQEQVQQQASQDAPPATVREARTTTRIHMPSDHFLVMSGMIREDTRLTANRIPCLGGLPFIGSLFSQQRKSFGKRNLMIFIRPIIIDTAEDIDELTRHREEVLKSKSTVQSGFNKQMDDLRMLLNLQDRPL
jgi:type III secretion protein C